MRRESRGHTARIQRPYGQTPRVRRGHTARHRGHARAPVPHGHARATDWLNPAGGLTEPTGPDNIHVTKSPGTLLPRTARRIQRGECPQPCFHTGRNIHTHKSPRPLSMTMARRILRLILLTRLRSNDPSWLVPLPDRSRRQRSIPEV